MKANIKLGLIILVTLLLATPALGASAGSVLLLKGKLKIQKADSYQIVETPNTPIEITENDQIHTGENSRAKIQMMGQKETVHLYANSFLTLQKVDEDKSQVSILIGKARFVVEPTVSRLSSLRRTFEIRTGNAYIGIRGTDVAVQTDGDSTSVLTVSGTVGVANRSNLEQVVEVTKNQATRTRKNDPPSPAVDVPAETVESILATDEPADWGVDFGVQPSQAQTQQPAAEDNLQTVAEVAETVEVARDTVKDTTATQKSIELTITEKEDSE